MHYEQKIDIILEKISQVTSGKGDVLPPPIPNSNLYSLFMIRVTIRIRVTKMIKLLAF